MSQRGVVTPEVATPLLRSDSPRTRAILHAGGLVAMIRSPSMVTYEQLREHLGHKPFRPLRIKLEGGKQLDVTRPNQVVAMKRRLYVGPGKDVPFWIWLEQIDHVELIDARPA